MNALLRVFLLACLLSTATAVCSCQDKTPPVRQVAVIGSCIIKVVPDEMLWSIQVSVSDATLARAKTRHDGSLGDALKYLKGLGDALKDLQTGGISFERNLYPGDDPVARRNPFSCTTQITFTLTDFEKYGAICDALAKLDGAQVLSVNYATSKEAETRHEALKRALLDAHDKASDLATTAGMSIDKPLSVDEQEAYYVSPETSNTAMPAPGTGSYAAPAVVAGQIEITAKVVATYDLHP
jgi:uncharacterized protein YggE